MALYILNPAFSSSASKLVMSEVLAHNPAYPNACLVLHFGVNSAVSFQ